MKFGIIKERKNPPDRRVVFTPEELVRLQSEHPEAESTKTLKEFMVIVERHNYQSSKELESFTERISIEN